MKRNILLFTALAGVVYFALSSYASGPGQSGGGNRTGGPGSGGNTCAAGGCHSAGTANTQVALTLTDSSTGQLVTNDQYIPEHVYDVTLTGTNSAFSQFGFQCEALDSTDASTGTLKVGATQHLVTLGGKVLIEHSNRINATGGSLVANFKWIAPAAGRGKVTFYAMLNAVNGDFSSLGDAPSLPYSIQFTETPDSTVDTPTRIVTVLENGAVNVYPNPAINEVQVKISDKAAPSSYAIAVYDVTGKMVTKEYVKLNAGAATMNMNTSGWVPGVYYMHITASNNRQRVIPLVKK